MNKIACLIENLGASQYSHSLIKNFNELSKNNDVYFFSKVPPMITSNICFSVMNIYNMNNFHGNIFATNIEDASILKKLTSKSKKFLYLWDIEWIRQPQDFYKNIEVLKSKDINLVVRSESHALIVENYVNKQVDYILEDWNHEQILKIVS